MDVREKQSNEKRLIDANARIAEYDRVHIGEPGKARKLIADAPTVDAVEVVRCRDCKYCDPENHHCDHPMSTAAPLSRKPDDFCSYVERKEGVD